MWNMSFLFTGTCMGGEGLGGGHSYVIFNDHIETLLFHNMFIFVLVQMASLASVAEAD